MRVSKMVNNSDSSSSDAGSNPIQGTVHTDVNIGQDFYTCLHALRPTRPLIPPGSINLYRLRLADVKVHAIADATVDSLAAVYGLVYGFV